jgi:hypothetical protein
MENIVVAHAPSIEEWLRFLLGEVSRREQLEMEAVLRQNPHLSAYLDYLENRLEDNDFNIEPAIVQIEKELKMIITALEVVNEKSITINNEDLYDDAFDETILSAIKQRDKITSRLSKGVKFVFRQAKNTIPIIKRGRSQYISDSVKKPTLIGKPKL